MLTLPGSVSKNAANSIALNKTTLFALPAVQADAYFSVQANVEFLVLEYNSDPGNQKEILRFDLSQANPQASFQVSNRARDLFLLERAILIDFDGGTLSLERAQLPSGLDITFGPQVPSGPVTEWISFAQGYNTGSRLLLAPLGYTDSAMNIVGSGNFASYFGQMMAQTFTATKNAWVKKVQFPGHMTQNPSNGLFNFSGQYVGDSGPVTMELRNVTGVIGSGGSMGSVLSSASVVNTGTVLTPAVDPWAPSMYGNGQPIVIYNQEAVFSTPVQLTNGLVYAVVLKIPENTTNGAMMTYGQDGAYSGGNWIQYPTLNNFSNPNVYPTADLAIKIFEQT